MPTCDVMWDLRGHRPSRHRADTVASMARADARTLIPTQCTNQSRAVLASSALRSFARMSAMRPDMTTKHSRHRASNAASASTASTTRAPNAGGFEYNARANLPRWPLTAEASRADAQDATTAPARSEYKPKFLLNEMQAHGCNPFSQNSLNGAASLSTSPDAKPRYAESKTGRKRFLWHNAQSSRHCSEEGSTPLGLCAHRCNKMMAPSSACSRSATSFGQSNFIPSK
mmetsp:Transcript_9550/g.29742  ORF Transcript_9550/g.29742 Transcript_9550/m.29742 type:complete len:229 (+) Transcript_9550:174-860(+)